MFRTKSAIDGEEYYTCPYNPAHRILHYRFQTHLVKCRKNYPDSNTIQCCFDITHIIPEPEYKYHIENCKARISLDKAVFIPEEVLLDKYPVKNVRIDTGESWDDDDTPTYNPEEYCKSNPVLRRLDLGSASQRRNFRMEERKRFQQFKEEEYNPPRRNVQQLRRPKKVTDAIVTKIPKEVDENVPEPLLKLMANTNISNSKSKKEQKAATTSEMIQKSEDLKPGVPDDGEWITAGGKKSRGRARLGKA